MLLSMHVVYKYSAGGAFAAAPLTCFRLSNNTHARPQPTLVGNIGTHTHSKVGHTEHEIALFQVKAHAFAEIFGETSGGYQGGGRGGANPPGAQ